MRAAQNYREVSEKLESLRKELKNKIEDLKNTDWRSDAGRAFMEIYEDNWSSNVEKYAAVLKEMAGQLERAASEYDSVTDKLKAIEGISV